MRLMSLALLMLLAGVPRAQADPLVAGPGETLRCLAAADPLQAYFRSALQKECLAVPVRLCRVPGQPDPVGCLSAVIVAFEDFYAETRPTLPPSIDAVPMDVVSYERALGRIDSAFRASKSCRGLSPWDETRCHYQDLASAVLDIFLSLRRADVAVAVRDRAPDR